MVGCVICGLQVHSGALGTILGLAIQQNVSWFFISNEPVIEQFYLCLVSGPVYDQALGYTRTRQCTLGKGPTISSVSSLSSRSFWLCHVRLASSLLATLRFSEFSSFVFFGSLLPEHLPWYTLFDYAKYDTLGRPHRYHWPNLAGFFRLILKLVSISRLLKNTQAVSVVRECQRVIKIRLMICNIPIVLVSPVLTNHRPLLVILHSILRIPPLLSRSGLGSVLRIGQPEICETTFDWADHAHYHGIRYSAKNRHWVVCRRRRTSLAWYVIFR